MLSLFMILVALGSIAAAFLTFYFLIGALGAEAPGPSWFPVAIFALLIIDMLLIAAFWPGKRRRSTGAQGRDSS